MSYSMHKKAAVWYLKYVLCINIMHLSSVTSSTVKFLIGTLLKIHRHSFHKKQFLSLAEWVFYSKASSQSRKHMLFVSFKNQWRLCCCNRVGSCSFVLLWGFLLHDKTPPLEKLIPLSKPERVFRPSVTQSAVQRVMRTQGRFWWRSLQPTFH